MKLLSIFSFIFIISFVQAEEKVVSLDEVASAVKKSNFTVIENAERIYQARETIAFSKRNLLPRLNFWNILKIPFDPLSAIDIVQDIAPFLVPNNWFRVSQNKLFYLAKKEQYRALWANEVMTAKLLYVNTLRDIDFLKLLKTQKVQINELVEIVKTRAVFGAVPLQVLNFLKIREMEIEEDIRSLNTIIFAETKAISLMIGVPQEIELTLESIELPKIEELNEISFDTFVFRALDNAPELNQYAYIKESLRFIRKEAYFSFMGSSTTARAAGGGAFNNIPIQDGFGFGLGSTIRIAKSESRILDINAKATKEVIKKNLYNLVYNFNSYIQNIENQNERFGLATDNYENLRTQLVLGMNLDPIQMLTIIDNLFDASLSLVNYKYEVVNTVEKLKRSIFNGDYSKKEGMLESVTQGEVK
jgi:hypothetical protein